MEVSVKVIGWIDVDKIDRQVFSNRIFSCSKCHVSISKGVRSEELGGKVVCTSCDSKLKK